MSWPEIADSVLGVCESVFGEPVVYTPQGQSALNITGIYDDLYESVDPNTNAIVTSDQPVLGVQHSEMGITPKQGDLVTVRGANYTVKEVQIDGQGGSKLFLHRTA